MLHVQEYLRSGKTLEQLRLEHGVKSFVQNGKISLSYDQIEAKESDPLSQQCRGLILDQITFYVIACPMFRFFNLEQTGVAAVIDYNEAVFEEKLDGSLIIVHYDFRANQWFCATRSRQEADVPNECGKTFTELVNYTLQTNYKLYNISELMEKSKDISLRMKTFCFELCSPLNQIVCQYKDFSLTLLAVRDNNTLQEENPKVYAEKLGVPVIKTYSFNSISELLEVVKLWDPKEQEGIVIKDSNFNRIKVKNPAYIAYNHMRDSLSTSLRGCMEVILLGRDDDVIAMVPDFIGDRIRKLKPLVSQVLNQTQKDYEELKHIDDMKEYAKQAQTKLWAAALFALKRNKTKDLLTFAQGNNKLEQSKLPTTAVDMMLSLCEKLDISIKDL